MEGGAVDILIVAWRSCIDGATGAKPEIELANKAIVEINILIALILKDLVLLQ